MPTNQLTKPILLTNLSTFLQNLYAAFVAKVPGKGLSANDFTNASKDKLDNLATVAITGDYDDLTNKPAASTTPGLPAGGSANQVLCKTGAGDYDAGWTSSVTLTQITADVVVGAVYQ